MAAARTTEPTTTKPNPTPGPRRNRRRIALSAAIAATLALVLVGCGDKFTEPFKDAPRSHKENGAPMDLIRMADGFSNLGSKCDGPNRVYVVYHGENKYGSLAVVANDPRCTK
ncbi:hypothetical protein OG413_41275 [Streptomyces sp. NBC_01433]|uniref:hypothetical protein n=1 Tax=Streptomyces sp. NBC_01433 TaxID=2903864 RepID=UPI0022504FB7|nr:hypothetical protein [Streptomyces sp. NBC_01433]MCX4681636.1 hypothetical protein [Streptomyces sp. NBC_01433]